MTRNRTRALIVAALVVVLAALVVLLLLRSGDEAGSVDAALRDRAADRVPQRRRVNRTPEAKKRPNLARGETRGQKRLQLALRTNVLPPPGRAQRPERLERGELPMNPPLFDDPKDRAKYKAYWIAEFKRRARIWEKDRLERDDLVPDQELEDLLDKFYDAAERAPRGESAEEAQARLDSWTDAWQEFRGKFDTFPGSVATYAMDPQYGEIPEPPVEPPGYLAADPEAEPEAYADSNASSRKGSAGPRQPQ